MTEPKIEEMKEGAVTFLDILGWKGIWQRKPDALNNLRDLIHKAEQQVEIIMKKENYPKAKPNVFKNLSVEVKSISDTIAIVTYGSCEEAIAFHGLISASVISRSIKLGIPVRGATCYGQLLTEGNILLGPAIDEVASWYEIADWIGVFLTPSAIYQCTEYLVDNLFVEHDVSIKHYGKIKTYCVNWIGLWEKNERSEQDIKTVFLDMGPITPDIWKKFNNTLEFYSNCQGKKYAFNKV